MIRIMRSSSPDEMSSRPAIIRSVVDLPHPEGPTNIMNSLSSISRLKSFTASNPFGYTLHTFLNDKLAILIYFLCPCRLRRRWRRWRRWRQQRRHSCSKLCAANVRQHLCRYRNRFGCKYSSLLQGQQQRLFKLRAQGEVRTHNLPDHGRGIPQRRRCEGIRLWLGTQQPQGNNRRSNREP